MQFKYVLCYLLYFYSYIFNKYQNVNKYEKDYPYKTCKSATTFFNF